MKVYLTRRELKKNFKYIIGVGYMRIQNLLKYQDASWYFADKDGWAADIYQIEDIAICTGYRPFGNIKIATNIVQEYDIRAMEICKNGKNFEEIKKSINLLLKEFIQIAIKEAKK